ncbi:hypothetical protein MRX96_037889 [Rhipicephalus microplus]
MPAGQRLRLKYLKEAFDKDMEKIRDDMRDVKKRLLGQSFEDYRPLFMSVTDNVDSLNDEFNQYLLEASPTNPAVELIEY